MQGKHLHSLLLQVFGFIRFSILDARCSILVIARGPRFAGTRPEGPYSAFCRLSSDLKIGFVWVCFHQVSNSLYFHNPLCYMYLHSVSFSIIGFVLHNCIVSRISYVVLRIAYCGFSEDTYGTSLGFAGHWEPPLIYD